MLKFPDLLILSSTLLWSLLVNLLVYLLVKVPGSLDPLLDIAEVLVGESAHELVDLLADDVVSGDNRVQGGVTNRVVAIADLLADFLQKDCRCGQIL